MSVSETPKQLEGEWKNEKGLEEPSFDRIVGFRDAVEEDSSWRNNYETGSNRWEDYAKGWDEGKKLLEKKSGKEAIREAFLDLLTLKTHYTPESEHYEVDDDVPLFTESYLYALLGKGDARTVLALLRNLMEKCGFERRELERKRSRLRNQ